MRIDATLKPSAAANGWKRSTRGRYSGRRELSLDRTQGRPERFLHTALNGRIVGRA